MAGRTTRGKARCPSFFWTDGGYEYPLSWGIVALAFVIRGGGRYSLDAKIGREI